MNRILLLSTILISFTTLQAQSVEQGGRQLYYERYGSAVNTYKQITKQQPGNAAAWHGLVRAYLLQNENAQAVNTIRMAPESVKAEPFYLVGLGAALLSENKKDSANIFFKSALERTKYKDASVLAAIAQANIEVKSGDAAYAVDLLNQAIKRDKRNPHLDVLLGDAYRKMGNGSEAYKAYHSAIEKDGKHAAAYHKTGEIFLSQKNPGLYLEYFTKAVNADARYSPSFYKLYTHAFYNNPAKAKQYYKSYMTNADSTVQNQYDLVDLMYLNKEYNKAIQKASFILNAEGKKVQPRLYKLIGFSYAGLKDTMQGIDYMEKFLEREADSNIISKDYAALASFYSATDEGDSMAVKYYTKAINHEQDSALLYVYFKKLADVAKGQKDYATQAIWLGKYYSGNSKANNLNLFNWGLAHYRAGEYQKSDSVFGMYVQKYPTQGFGYYWQAKSKALQDTAMKEGLAIPAYVKLIEVLEKDTTAANYEKWMVESYGYLAAYEANIKKDYTAAIEYFEKILAINPENESAEKYIAILKNDLANKKAK